jgi:endonuclease/exonuclease/phosphatase family metal-dependent hydrolase
MIFRIATLNLAQNHKCWVTRRELIAQQLEEIRPDIWALNEIHIPSQTGRWLQRAAEKRLFDKFSLLQQSKTGEKSRTEAEGLLARHARYVLIETANLDYRSHDCMALVARFQIGRSLVDIYVTHLIAARVPDSARHFQVSQLVEWIRQRKDAGHSIVCGDFNAQPDQPSIRLMSEAFRPTQTQATAFTPLSEAGSQPTHPEWPRFDRCIDYIWVSEGVQVSASGLCFDKPALDNHDLWPSDHIGVWADLELA